MQATCPLVSALATLGCSARARQRDEDLDGHIPHSQSGVCCARSKEARAGYLLQGPLCLSFLKVLPVPKRFSGPRFSIETVTHPYARARQMVF